MKFTFIHRHSGLFKVARMCAMPDESRGGCDEWLDRPAHKQATAEARATLTEFLAVEKRRLALFPGRALEGWKP